MATGIHNLQSRKLILPLGFVVIICLMFFTNVTATSQMKKTYEAMLTNTQQTNTIHSLLGTMMQAALKRSLIINEMFHYDDPFLIDELYMQLNAAATTFTVARETFSEQSLDTKLIELLNQQGQLARINAPLQNQVFEYLRLEEKEKASELFHNITLSRQKAIIDIINEMATYQFINAKQSLQKSRLKYKNIEKTILIFDLLSLVISILLASYIIRRQIRSDKKLNTLANTDMLTALPNRTNFINHINNQISRRPSEPFAIIFFDIDYFKSINDNYGHEIGDEILKRFSSEIKNVIYKDDILSRFGGDEFVLLLRSIKNKNDAIRFIDRLSKQSETSYRIGKQEIFITSSMGASLYPQSGHNAKRLLQRADMAMYAAKQAGRNCYKMYSRAIREKIEREHEISHALHTVLKKNDVHNELFLKYQPLMNINTGGITECEALIGWKTAQGNVIPADEFIPLAEKSNLIEKINLFVINTACQQQLDWQKAGIKNMRININLSGNKLMFKKLLDQLNKNIRKMGLKYSQFGIELTERTLYEISESTIKQLNKARGKGIKIAIDDFGTDYSSLCYLKKLPVTTLKMDKVFISGLPDDKDDCALVQTIIILGHSLGLDIVAEGVETLEQYEFLKKHDCNFIQGYYFHHPLNYQQISKLKLAA